MLYNRAEAFGRSCKIARLLRQGEQMYRSDSCPDLTLSKASKVQVKTSRATFWKTCSTKNRAHLLCRFVKSPAGCRAWKIPVCQKFFEVCARLEEIIALKARGWALFVFVFPFFHLSSFQSVRLLSDRNDETKAACFTTLNSVHVQIFNRRRELKLNRWTVHPFSFRISWTQYLV